MQVTPAVEAILGNHRSDNLGSKADPARTRMQRMPSSIGNLVVPLVDQGFEHGPARSFAPNPAAYGPDHHAKLMLAAASQVARQSPHERGLSTSGR